MEASQPPPTTPESAVLIVQNGRLSGARRVLALPLTLIGQAPGCDVRLTIDGVNPLHCAILQVPGGLLLRDLGSEQGTYVNQEKVTTWPLATGDVIGVGPFLFRVELPASEPGTGVEADSKGLTAERDALRIQAAAVAAQQARLTDEETQLNQRRDALEQREQQIAEHLEDRQRRLLELREEIKQERTAADEKRAAREAELARARKQAERERHRFAEARKRFKQRWLSYTAEKQTSLHQREQHLLAEQQKLQKDLDAYQRERQHFAETRLRLNGETELGRRELKESWQELGLAQQQWEEVLNVEHRERDQRLHALEAREVAVAEGESKLAADREHWQEARARLFQEVGGLENRVRTQRYQLQEMQPRPQSLATIAVPPLPLIHSTRDLAELPAIVQRLAGSLADQRWLLLEHWTRFLQIEEAWQRDHAELIAAAETSAERLRERDRHLDDRERSLDEREADLVRHQERFVRLRNELESWQTRLTLWESNGEGERTARLGAAELREQMATALVQQLEAVRRRRQDVRRGEIEELRQARAGCETVRQEYLALIRRFQERQAELEREQRELAARTVAVERFRQELLNRAPNSPAAEKRLEKLRRRSSARLAAAERKVTSQRQTLLAESRRLEERARRLQQREEELTGLEEQLNRQQAEWEREQIAHAQNELPRERELRLLKMQHEYDGRQLAALRDEVERVARLLLDSSSESVGLAA